MDSSIIVLMLQIWGGLCCLLNKRCFSREERSRAAASIWEFGGIKTLNQVLELGIAGGFLMGTYLMAKDMIQGYFWLMLGNVTCSALMGIEGYHLLMVQQLVSLVFVTDACMVREKRLRTGPREKSV